jgi:oligopeptide transport system ATP-binding protein
MLLSVRDLIVRFRTHDGAVHAVNGVSFDLEEGETLGMVGESGCGKSVTNLAMMRLLPQPAGRIEGGQVLFDDIDLTKLSEAEMRDLRGREIAMIFQDPMTSLNPVLTIEEQLVETIRAHKVVTSADARTRAIELLGMVGIAEPARRLRSYPHQFSGGMRQRVMIAIALSTNPDLLIADEPTTALDVTIQAQILDLMRGLSQEFQSAVILITHDMGVVAGMAERVAVMYAGYVVEAGKIEDIFYRARHPYTHMLLQSIPRLDRARDAPLKPIPGQPPDLLFLPPGCPFAPRCPNVQDICRQKMPPLDPAGEPGHLAACWNPVQEASAA